MEPRSNGRQPASIEEVAAHVALGLHRDDVEALVGPVDDATWDRATVEARRPLPPAVEYRECYAAAAALEASLASSSPKIDANDDVVVPIAEPCAGVLGLERHLVIACAGRDRPGCVHAMARVGIDRAWAGLDLVAATYHQPAGTAPVEALRVLQGTGRVPWYLDVRVERSYQSTNPRATFNVRGGMDWFTWSAYARQQVLHAARLEKSPQWLRRKVVEHGAGGGGGGGGGGTGGMDPRVHASVMAALDGDWKAVDVPGTRGPRSWEPRVAAAGAFAAGTCHETLVVTSPDAKQARRVHALARAFPMADVLEGEGTTRFAGGGQRSAPVLVIDGRVPSNGAAVLADMLATLVLSEVQPDPACIVLLAGGADEPVVLPPGYPRNPARLFAGRRAPSVDGRVLSLAGQWAAQERLNKMPRDGGGDTSS